MSRSSRRRALGRSRALARRSAAGGPPRAASAFLRRLLLSEYFVLYLTIAYFVVLAVFFPDLAEPRNISNQLSNVWPLLAVAIGQTFVIIIAGIDLSPGAIMGFVSVVGAVVMASAADQLLLGGSPLWGTLLERARRAARRHRYAVAVAVGVMLLVGIADRPRSTASSSPASACRRSW